MVQEQLQAGKQGDQENIQEDVQEDPLSLLEWIRTLLLDYNPDNDQAEWISAELDGDPTTNEWLTVLVEPFEESYQKSFGIVLAEQGEGFTLRGFEFPAGSDGHVRLETVGDLNDDGKNEMIWGYDRLGAHTTSANYIIMDWEEEGFKRFKGDLSMPNVTDVQLEGNTLLLTGGGSAQ